MIWRPAPQHHTGAGIRLHAWFWPWREPWPPLAVFCTVYWILLVAFEAYGYHAVQIRDTAVSQYPELPLLRCMHMPGWMRAVYFSMGPVFFVLCEPLWRAGEAGRQALTDPVAPCGRSPATRSGPMPEPRPTAIATQE